VTDLPDGHSGDDAQDDLDAQEDREWDTEAEVVCPYCGEGVTIGLDPAGGTVQRYVEDCQVCCRPWQVRVTYDTEGAAHVRVEIEP
jgi:transposase-like protein